MRQSITLTLPIGVFLIILFPYLNYIPMWDSGNYLSHCVLKAVNQPFNIMAFNCSNHGSIVFGLFYGALQYISFGNSLCLHLTSFALLITGFYFYHAILKHFFKDKPTIFIGMALMCWNPAVVANAINPTPDLVVLVFSIICLWAFINQRIGYAALSGLALLFSKESGIVYYGLCSFLYLTLHYSAATNRRDFLLKNILMLSWPFVIYGLFCWYKTTYLQSNLLFHDTSILFLINQIFLVAPVTDERFSNFSAFYAVFLLNFQWIVAAGILIGVISSRFGKQDANRDFFRPFDRKDCMYIFLLALLLVYVLSRYPHYLNVRYYLPVFPLTTLLFIYVLHRANFYRWRIFASVLCGLFVLSCFYTIDPVSRWFFGTFNFGSHALLNLPARTGECCGYGRDHLIYNLQHTELQTLLQQFAAQVELNKNDVIVADDLANFFVYERLMAHPHHAYALCLKRNDTAVISKDFAEMELRSAVNQSTRLFYPMLPNLKTEEFTQEVMSHLLPVQITRMSHNGYALNVMQLKAESFAR